MFLFTGSTVTQKLRCDTNKSCSDERAGQSMNINMGQGIWQDLSILMNHLHVHIIAVLCTVYALQSLH